MNMLPDEAAPAYLPKFSLVGIARLGDTLSPHICLSSYV